jgi:hypothetical protein
MVVHKNRESSIGEDLGVAVERHGSGRREPVGHHDCGTRYVGDIAGRVQPTSEGDTVVGWELDVETCAHRGEPIATHRRTRDPTLNDLRRS